LNKENEQLNKSLVEKIDVIQATFNKKIENLNEENKKMKD